MNIFVFGINHFKNIFPSNQTDCIAMENNEEVIARLKFIGHIEKEEKINVRQCNRQPNNFLTKLSRTLIYPDNRSNSLKFIKDVILRSFDIIESLIHNRYILTCKSIISDLVKAKQGMLNLKYTYNDDTKFCCDMDVLIEQVTDKLTSLKETHPTLFEQVKPEIVSENSDTTLQKENETKHKKNKQ
jgi:hypothetical protein